MHNPFILQQAEGISKASTEEQANQPRLFDRSWEAVQKKTFTNWINTQLKKRHISPLEDLNVDLCTGEKLIQLLEIIGDENLGKYNKNPKLRIQKFENLNKALEFIRRRGVNLTNIGAEDVVDSNPKLILGLIWTIILRFTISEISEEGLSAKDGLLLWCQRRTTPYAQDFKINDFTFSWQNGLALCALIHRHRPDLLNYWELDKSDKRGNTQLAFDIAEQKLGIAKLLDVEDLVDVAKPDERSVMTYVAQYYHVFSQQDKTGVAGRRVGQFGTVLQQTWEMENDYEQRVRALLDSLQSQISQWSQSSFADYRDAKRQLVEFESYKVKTKRSWITERRNLDSLLGEIQTKLKTYNLRAYIAPEGLTPEDVAANFAQLVETEGNHKRAISAFIREAKDAIRQKFANVANQLQADINAVGAELTQIDGELEQQLEQVQGLLQRAQNFDGQLNEVRQANEEVVEASIEDNEFTVLSVEDLEFDLGLLKQSLQKKAGFIQNQIVARTKTNITPEKLEQFSETFRRCDRDSTNTLFHDEFRSALHAEGEGYENDEEFEKVWVEVSKGEEAISFQQFIDYVTAIEEDRTTPDQLEIAFNTLANGKDYVTEAELYQGGLQPSVVEYFKQVLPPKNDGYDYSLFLGGVFI